MCGIAGYLGNKPADSVLIVALERLKYRGYDSAGVAILDNDSTIHIRKAAGKLGALSATIDAQPLTGQCGIAHTRWATHGPPTTDNSHPHVSTDGRIAVVHNGIIENHDALRTELRNHGVIFRSQTDTEVIPHLLASYYQGDAVAALRSTVARLQGSFAFAVLFADRPDAIFAVRQGSPLIIGRGKQNTLPAGREIIIASDVPALLPHAQQICIMGDGHIAELTPQDVRITTFEGKPVEVHFKPIDVSVDAVSKGSYDSFMAKEIAEQPHVLSRILASRLRSDGQLVDPDLSIDLASIQHFVFLACGTSWHTALLGKRFLEQLARVHVEVDISSEYRYRNPLAEGGTLVVAISQSGETADTLAGLRLAKAKFIPTISLVNTVTSTIARESSGMMPLLAGPEIGVASTKAYTGQVLALYLFALQVAKAKGLLDRDAEARAIAAAYALPEQVASTLALSENAVVACANLFHSAHATVFLGRGGEFPTALEGALKLKEIAYVHAFGYAAGEFKHGPIALVTKHLPVVCLCPSDAMFDKMISNIQEVRARAGRIIAVSDSQDCHLHDLCDHVFPTAKAHDELLQPLLSILPLQRYAYHVALRRLCDVDQPRNLAKSVTVE